MKAMLPQDAQFNCFGLKAFPFWSRPGLEFAKMHLSEPTVQLKPKCC
jgi:hypothetical protein